MARQSSQTITKNELHIVNSASCHIGYRSVPETYSLIDLGHLVPSAEMLRTIGLDEGIEELAASIAEHGVLQPLLVRRNGSASDTQCYEILAGHRRYRAALMVGMHQVPCIVHDVDTAEGFLLSFAENLQRENLHPLDEAWAYDALIEKGIARNRAEIARCLGVSRSRITQRMELLRLDDVTKHLLIRYASTLTEYHARLLLKVDCLDARHHLAMIAGQDALSGRELRIMIEDLERRKNLEAWQNMKEIEGFPRSYRAVLPGLRLSIDYARVDKRRTAELLRRQAALLEQYPPVKTSSSV